MDLFPPVVRPDILSPAHLLLPVPCTGLLAIPLTYEHTARVTVSAWPCVKLNRHRMRRRLPQRVPAGGGGRRPAASAEAVRRHLPQLLPGRGDSAACRWQQPPAVAACCWRSGAGAASHTFCSIFCRHCWLPVRGLRVLLLYAYVPASLHMLNSDLDKWAGELMAELAQDRWHKAFKILQQSARLWQK